MSTRQYTLNAEETVKNTDYRYIQICSLIMLLKYKKFCDVNLHICIYISLRIK